MSCALFIHRDQNFLNRIQSEAQSAKTEGSKELSGFEFLTSSSLVQGLRIIANPEVALSGIYFDPTDTSYSALRFIELSVMQRPATPLFLIHPEVDPAQISSQILLKKTNLRGSFRGHESLIELTKSLNLSPVGLLKDLKRQAAPRSEHAGYVAVPVVDFINETRYPFDVFIEDAQKKLAFFAAAQSEVDPEYLLHATSISNWFYISEQDIAQIRAGLRDTQLRLMEIESFPSLWKTAEVLFNAKALLNEMRKSGLSDQLVEHTLYMLGDVFQMVSFMALEKENRNLVYFVEQAKNCDQTIASATLSMLMCKTMKFDRNAVLEILGLASLLQDVSLYNSPYGDLSKAKPDDLPPDAQAYYLQHPLVSADLVSQHTSVPDVALQVIRQHHERKDRTGYPNRIGGMQLHPMAEVLSLINAFLEITESAPTVVTLDIYQKLEKNVFPHYSDKTVVAFKSILENFLRSSLAYSKSG